MAEQLFANNATTTIRGSLSTSATTIFVNDSTGFPSPTGGDWFIATLDGGGNYFEIVKVTAVNGIAWTVQRAQEGTTAKLWQPGSRIECRVTKGTLEGLRGSGSIVNAATFGVVGNDIVDDTAALQAFINYLTTTHQHGFLPTGTYKITSKLNITGTFGWGIIGAGQEATIIKQYTDNTPILDLGAVAGPGMHSYIISDIKLDYNASQPSTNTNANPIRFSQMGYEGELNRITFARGSWAIKVVSGIGGPWGQHWDNLNFGGGLTGGAMDWTGATNAVPNNHWGRFLITASNMVGPIFKQIKGYNWTWDNCELLDGNNCQWIDCQAGALLNLNAIKMELCEYTGSPTMNGDALMYFPAGRISIGQVHLGGTFCIFTVAANRYVFNAGTGGSINVGMFVTELTVAPTNFFLASLNGGNSSVNYLSKGTFPIDYTIVVSSASADNLTVFPDKNDRLSSNKGDANYTIVAGDPAVISFETTLTASRTVTLPAGNTCFNGLRYKIISYGAVNGANTIVISAAGNTKATLSADKTFVELEWRRNATPHLGWRLVDSGTLP